MFQRVMGPCPGFTVTHAVTATFGECCDVLLEVRVYEASLCFGSWSLVELDNDTPITWYPDMFHHVSHVENPSLGKRCGGNSHTYL